MYDDDDPAGRLRHQLHVLADAPAAHRHGPGPARPRHARHARSAWSRRQPPLRVRQGDGPPGCRSSTQRERRPDMAKTKTPAKTPRRPTKPAAAAERTYDAIVVGGGHNGLVNGAYLAKAGLKTLILERRHLVGGAAITEELYPGFWFTTFSYALSLLRPDIIHELELVKHGFMPILMPSTFAPMENGDYLLLGQDHDQNLKEIARHCQHDADAYRPYEHDLEMVCQRSSRCSTRRRRTSSATTPRSSLALASLGSRLRRDGQAGPPRRGPAAHRQRRRLPRRLLRDRHPQGLPRLVEHHRHQGRADVAGLGAGPAVPHAGRARRATSGRGPSTRAATAGSPRCWPGPPESFGAEIGLESPVDRRDHQGRPGDRRRPGRRHRVPRPTVVSALDPRRTFTELVDPRELPTDLVENIHRFRFQGTSPRSTSRSTGCRGTRRSATAPTSTAASPTSARRSSTSSAPTTTPSTAGTATRPYLDCAIQSLIDPDMAPPGKHVMELVRPVRAVPPARERLGHRAGEPRRHRPGDDRVVLPGLRRPGAAPRGRHPARHRADRRAVRGQHLRRRVPGAADVLLPAGARAGASTAPRSTATTSAAPAPTPAAA